MKDELDVFVRDALARGVPRDRISAALEDAGWPRKDIDSALGAWADTDLGVPVPKRRVGLAARETFLQLVLFATLYVVAFSVGAVLFAAIERWIPDKAFTRWQSYASTVRWGTAYILIALPVHLWISRIISRAGASGGDGQPSPVDRWLTYLTLFVAALTLIGNLVVVVSGLLGGELTARFLLKAVVVFCIAGVVFGHHLGRMTQQEKTGAVRGFTRWAAPSGIVVAVLTAILGLWMSGTPGAARAHQLDVRRIEHLHRIRFAVNKYFEASGELPGAMHDLDTVPVGLRSDELEDPGTGEPYTYTLVDSARYELCATFTQATPRSDPGVRRHSQANDVFWKHPAGRHCFQLKAPRQRTVSP